MNLLSHKYLSGCSSGRLWFYTSELFIPKMSIRFTQRYQTKIAEPADRVAPPIESETTTIPIEGILNHLQIWEQKRLSLPQILTQARWFILWHQPSGDSTPFGFAVLGECPNAIYGYS